MSKYECVFLSIIVVAVAVVLSSMAFNCPKVSEHNSPSGVGDGLPAPSGEHTFEDLLDAIEWVESKGNPLAVGDGGEAIGAYQIHKIYVDDVNRIWRGHGRIDGFFEYDDRLSSNESRRMVAKYLKHYGGTFEEMARKHNGGPKGHLKESTKPYWEKVKARLYRTDKRNL
jgi:hypothetical protein